MSLRMSVSTMGDDFRILYQMVLRPPTIKRKYKIRIAVMIYVGCLRMSSMDESDQYV